ncbi:hypothetical protein C7M61_004002 [Candidozyma pseudohaemuli]|uniref:Uncharacterized protein n=1 Tax=Candidozyma pseudohaemuli TaxID=418784 RepID=A0A2P7YKN5_9ASCO|nr:hypothetical protein C7M61_004002 [[Candida] pseudohaemulonii]PSK36529.1 hypothetical protein C7M61_004002 [[Candida] pseudohaemulonii]
MNIRYSKLMPPREPEKSTIDKLTYVACVVHVVWRLAILAFLGWLAFSSTSTLALNLNDLVSQQGTSTSVSTHSLTNQQISTDNFISFAKATNLGTEYLSSTSESTPPVPKLPLAQVMKSIQETLTLDNSQFGKYILPTSLSIFVHYVLDGFALESCYNRSAHAKFLLYGYHFTWIEMIVVSVFIAAGCKSSPGVSMYSAFLFYLCFMNFNYHMAAAETVARTPAEGSKLDEEGKVGDNPDSDDTASNNKSGPRGDIVTIHEQNNYHFNQHFHPPWEHARPRVAPFAPGTSAPSGQGTSQGNASTASPEAATGASETIQDDGSHESYERFGGRVTSPNQAPQQNST